MNSFLFLQMARRAAKLKVDWEKGCPGPLPLSEGGAMQGIKSQDAAARSATLRRQPGAS